MWSEPDECALGAGFRAIDSTFYFPETLRDNPSPELDQPFLLPCCGTNYLFDFAKDSTLISSPTGLGVAVFWSSSSPVHLRLNRMWQTHFFSSMEPNGNPLDQVSRSSIDGAA
jgi:hypothetical protein